MKEYIAHKALLLGKSVKNQITKLLWSPNTVVKNSAKSPMKLQLCSQKYGCWKNQQKVQRNSYSAPENMVVGKASRKSNEMVALLPKHGCWKNQQKVQWNCYAASETWSLEKSAENPTKQLLSSRNMVVGKISKNSYETIALLSKHGRWKNKWKVQWNFNFAPETLLEISVKGPTKRLLWYWNMVIAKHHQNVQWNGHFAPKVH